MSKDLPLPPQTSGLGLPPSLENYDHLKIALEAAQEELVESIRERASIEWRINKLQNDIVHLAALCRVEVQDPIKELGLTDAVRWIFSKDDKRALAISEVVVALKESGYDVSEYKNLTANIHTIVKRLLKANEIKDIPAAPPFSGTRFKWTGGLGPPPVPTSWLKELLEKRK